MYIMRSMHEHLYIIVLTSISSVFSELIKNYERNKIDIWRRSLESVHVSGFISKCYIDLYSIAVEVLLASEFVHQNTKNRCSLERIALLQLLWKIVQYNINSRLHLVQAAVCELFHALLSGLFYRFSDIHIVVNELPRRFPSHTACFCSICDRSAVGILGNDGGFLLNIDPLSPLALRHSATPKSVEIALARRLRTLASWLAAALLAQA